MSQMGHGGRFHQDIQYKHKVKIYKMFIPGIFHLICSDYDCLKVTKTSESETMNNGVHYIKICETIPV
jgi:hypothetical protein